MRYQNATIEGLINEITDYNQKSNIALIKQAYQFAKEKTDSAQDESGRPLIEHLLNCAQIAAEFRADDETIAAALLHDTAYKGKATTKEIEKEFGKEIANLIEELIKIIEIEDKNADLIDANILAKVILATSTDMRAIFLELAARTEVLKAIEKYPKEKQIRLANGSLKIYAQICHKLGLEKLKWEMEDLSLKIINPDAYKKIKEKLCVKREVREKELEAIKKEISELLKENNFNATIQARVKNFFGINKKLEAGKPFAEINDLRGARIICNSIKECYEILGLIHSNYLPLTKEFQDYITSPKQSGYMSIHTCVYWNRKIIEVQIRTWEMHYESETGISAHWKYKKYEQDKAFDKKLSWVKQLIDWQQMYPNAKEFLKSLKIDFDEQQIFVFTPKKQVVMLPLGATPVDFAFALHSELGLKCKQAKVNRHIAPLNHVLENGDMIEIITDNSNNPKRQWLNFVRSQKAKAKIKKTLGLRSQSITVVTQRQRKKNTKSINAPEIKIANCCNPLPGDEIVGYRTTKRKISVHRKDCPNIESVAKEKCVEVEWDENREHYQAIINISALDRAGLLNDILNKLAEGQAVINTTHVKINKNNISNCEFSIKIKKPGQLERILKEIKSIPNIYSVSRK